jgi:SPP1 gp7 family putative phage head morphogenesis protein
MASKNRELFNALTRHQIYIEGVKAWQVDEFQRFMNALGRELRTILISIGIDNLSQWGRRELSRLINTIRALQRKLTTDYGKELLATLRLFVATDSQVTHTVLDTIAARPRRQPMAKALWERVQVTPIAANGQNVEAFVTNFLSSTIRAVELEINKAWANKATPAQLAASVVGSPTLRFSDGLLSRLTAQGAAVINTAIQHASSVVQTALGRLYYDSYQWISILDSATTEICRSRNGNVYTYDLGPVPPAHHNCRSKIIPVADRESAPDTPQSFYAWTRAQSRSFLNDAIGATFADAALADGVTAETFPKFNGAKPLTLGALNSKVDLILGTKPE